MLKPYKHQADTTTFILQKKKALVTSDPGTGKTRSVLDAYHKLIFTGAGRMLVLAPLSILQASWGDDIDKFQPGIDYAIGYAKNREAAFRSNARIVIVNHDGIKWINENKHVLNDFSTICIDEFTAFKHKTSARSKALERIINHKAWPYRIYMSGTPNSNSITDIWFPMYLLDGGTCLGNRFYSFRSSVCTAEWNGFGHVWKPKDNAEEQVALAIKDVNVRFKLNECVDMPKQSQRTMYIDLSPAMLKKYKEFAETSLLEIGAEEVNAVHAGAKVKKLLQLCTGAVYDSEGKVVKAHNERYNLVMELVNARECSLVAFNWRHERDCLIKIAEKLKIKYAIIDGSTSAKNRTEVVKELQAGDLKVVFCHPQSAGHGLTMTAAKTIIWSSPTYNAEHYEQFNRRIHRIGQKDRTEIIHIAARDTWEPDVYAKLNSKLAKMNDLLGLLKNLTVIPKVRRSKTG